MCLGFLPNVLIILAGNLPDGRQLLLANSQMGNPEIFLTDSSGNIKQQLTHQPAIDLAPVWLPDGQSFIFTSDKAKFLQPQLYQYYFAKQQFLPLNLPGKTNAIARVSPRAFDNLCQR